MKFSKKDRIEIFENAISWLVVLAMLIYGGSKIVQFKGATAIDKPINQATGMELMWAFYGYSRAFAISLGFFEITGTILMLIKKTRILGCLIISTLLINIILQDIFFEVNAGALRAAILYQVCILIILWINKEKLIKSIKVLLLNKTSGELRTKRFYKFSIAFLLLILAEYLITTTS